MIYFTADQHFFHNNIIRHTGRPFRDTDEMNETLIRNWNKVIQPRDEVYILGDVTMKGPDMAYEVLSRLKGRKYLICGNHDRFVQQKAWEQYAFVFEWVKDYHRLNYNGSVLILCHYPFAEWDRKYYGSICLHGHSHNKKEYNIAQKAQGIRRYNVGVDANDFTPMSFRKLLEWFSDIHDDHGKEGDL